MLEQGLNFMLYMWVCNKIIVITASDDDIMLFIIMIIIIKLCVLQTCYICEMKQIKINSVNHLSISEEPLEPL